MGMMSDSMMGAMMFGWGLTLLLLVAVLILSVVALIKYIRSER